MLLPMPLPTLLPTTEPVPIWPATIGGWVTLFLSIAAALAVVYGWVKGLAHLNGLGGRVDSVTRHVEAIDARQDDLAKLIDRLTASTEQLLKDVGRTQRQAEDCDGNTEKFAIEIGSKLNDFQRELSARMSAISERLAGVERELELGRQVRFNPPS